LCPSVKDKRNKREGEWREDGQARVKSLVGIARKKEEEKKSYAHLIKIRLNF
jgi:hypothetical protein